MIITRYITRQVLQTTLAITLILVVVVAVGRLLNYLARASKGLVDPNLLLEVMAYRMPDFLQFILPLALLLGILLALGRLYADSEMTVLIATGMSPWRLLRIIAVAAVLVMALVAWLALQLAPQGSRKVSDLIEVQQNTNEFDLMAPGLFQNVTGGERTTYAETIDTAGLHNVFMHDAANNRVIKAESAVPYQDKDGARFVLFRNGSIAKGFTTDNSYDLTTFDEMGVRLPPRNIGLVPDVVEKTLSTRQLLESPQPSHLAELQWRLSLILSVPVVSLLAIPLARVSPRQGRYARLLPGIVLYLAYLGLLLMSKNAVTAEKLSPVAGLWWVHAVFFVLAALMFSGRLPVRRRA
ncbi:MAG TPA: LPS export ABC transporter permease LptF [Candidatus Acidoferrum sp.]|nr:LPS export ABC transporter permease LptF [Candidatus Acidoferrum sp.]